MARRPLRTADRAHTHAYIHTYTHIHITTAPGAALPGRTAGPCWACGRPAPPRLPLCAETPPARPGPAVPRGSAGPRLAQGKSSEQERRSERPGRAAAAPPPSSSPPGLLPPKPFPPDGTGTAGNPGRCFPFPPQSGPARCRWAAAGTRGGEGCLHTQAENAPGPADEFLVGCGTLFRTNETHFLFQPESK